MECKDSKNEINDKGMDEHTCVLLFIGIMRQKINTNPYSFISPYINFLK